MSQSQFESYSIQRSFDDFDEISDVAQQWNLDLRQLHRGSFQGTLNQFGNGNVHVSDAQFGQTLYQQGAPPDGLRTIVVPANQEVQFSWRRKKINGNKLLVFPKGGELMAISNPDFHVYTCTFPEEILNSISSILEVDELDQLTGNAEVVECDPTAMKAIRRCLENLSDTASHHNSDLNKESFVNGITKDLPYRLVSAMTGAENSCVPESSRKREQALILAESFIQKYASEDIRVYDICCAAKVSQRTLEYAFTERFGLTPRKFLIAYRLNAVRKELRLANHDSDKIHLIANGWGFWHMGQFAADYQKQFEELPSETLRRTIRSGPETL